MTLSRVVEVSLDIAMILKNYLYLHSVVKKNGSKI